MKKKQVSLNSDPFVVVFYEKDKTKIFFILFLKINIH